MEQELADLVKAKKKVILLLGTPEARNIDPTSIKARLNESSDFTQKATLRNLEPSLLSSLFRASCNGLGLNCLSYRIRAIVIKLGMVEQFSIFTCPRAGLSGSMIGCP